MIRDKEAVSTPYSIRSQQLAPYPYCHLVVERTYHAELTTYKLNRHHIYIL